MAGRVLRQDLRNRPEKKSGAEANPAKPMKTKAGSRAVFYSNTATSISTGRAKFRATFRDVQSARFSPQKP